MRSGSPPGSVVLGCGCRAAPSSTAPAAGLPLAPAPPVCQESLSSRLPAPSSCSRLPAAPGCHLALVAGNRVPAPPL